MSELENVLSTIAPQLDESLFHVRGIVEAQETLRSLLERLKASQGVDDEVFSTTLVAIRVEVFHHVRYHMKELRRPLKTVTDAVFDALPDLPDVEGSEA